VRRGKLTRINEGKWRKKPGDLAGVYKEAALEKWERRITGGK